MQNRYTRSFFLDVNADGAPDLVLGAENNTLSSAVLLNDGTGRFRNVPKALPPKAFGPRSITISLGALDVDRDGKVDLIAGFQREDFSGRRLQVLWVTATAPFTTRRQRDSPCRVKAAHGRTRFASQT